VSQATNAALVLVQSHFYSPASVGFLANVLSVATILSPLCSMQFPFAIPQQRDRREIAEIVVMTAISVATMFLVLNGAVAILALTYLRTDTAREIAFFGLVSAPFLILFDLGRMLAARDGAFREVGLQSATFAFFRAIIQVIGGVLGGSQFWLVAGETFGRFGALHVTRKSAVKIWRVGRSVRLHLSAAMRANWRFPVISLPSTLVDNLGGYLPPILIANLYGLDVAGLLFLAQRVVSFPIVLLVQSTADVIHVRAAQLAQSHGQSLLRFVLKTAAVFFILGVAVAIVMAGCVTGFWSMVFSARWHAAQEMAYALIITGILQTACGPITRILIVTNRQALKLIFDFTYLAAGCSPVLLSWAGCHLDAQGAVWSIAIGYTGAYAVYLAIILYAASRPIDLERVRP
jgi:O-antigen/teichoic acid export membrane protein